MMGDCEFQMQDCLAQIAMLDARIGAWEYVDSIGALNRARELDRVTIRGPLHGMAIGAKDIIDVAGMPTRCGSPIYALNMAKMDAACIALAKAAGAIIVGKTATTELAAFHPAKTRNPQNLGTRRAARLPVPRPRSLPGWCRSRWERKPRARSFDRPRIAV